MRTHLAWALATLMAAPPAAADHVIDVEALTDRITEASQRRAEALARIDEALEHPAVRRLAAALGTDRGRLGAAARSLDDGALQEAALHAHALQVAPPPSPAPKKSGPSTMQGALVLLVAVVLVIILIQRGLDVEN